MNKEEILKQIEEHEKAIAQLKEELRKIEKEVYIEWSGECDIRKHGKPYLAILTKGENGHKFEYHFLPTVNQRDKEYMKAIFQGNLKVGTILRGRVNASWKNDYTYFYIVTENGLETISEERALEELGILKKRDKNEKEVQDGKENS